MTNLCDKCKYMKRVNESAKVFCTNNYTGFYAMLDSKCKYFEQKIDSDIADAYKYLSKPEPNSVSTFIPPKSVEVSPIQPEQYTYLFNALPITECLECPLYSTQCTTEHEYTHIKCSGVVPARKFTTQGMYYNHAIEGKLKEWFAACPLQCVRKIGGK